MRPPAALALVALLLLGLLTALFGLAPAGGSRSEAASAPPPAGSPPGPAADSLALPGSPAERARARSVEPAPGSSPDLHPATTASEPTWLLAGRVVDPARRPVAGAAVRAAEEGLTDAAGRFRVTCEPPDAAGTVRVEVRAAGFCELALRTGTTANGRELDCGELTLVPGTPLRGRCVDPLGRGVAGARLVRAESRPDGVALHGFLLGLGERPALATTSADGGFLVASLPEGPWRVLVESEAHPDAVFEGESGPGGTSGLLFELPPGASIDGRVVGADPSRDLASVRVRAVPVGGVRMAGFGGPRPWREAACDNGGRFLLGGLDPAVESYELRAHLTGPMNGPRYDWCSESVHVPTGTQGVELVLFGVGGVSLRVVAAEDGRPLASPELTVLEVDGGDVREDRIRPEDPRRTTGPEAGRVALSGLRAPFDGRGSTLIVRAPGRRAVAIGPLELTGPREDLGTVALERTGALAVRVIDAASGAPIPGARVSLEPGDEGGEGLEPIELVRRQHELDATGHTDARGAVELEAPPGRTVLVQASSEEHVTGSARVVALAGGTPTPVEIGLAAGGSITARVVGPAGQVGGGAEVRAAGELYDGSGWNQTNETDADGVTRFTALAAGRYTLSAQGLEATGFDLGNGERPPGAVVVDLAAGAALDVVLERPAISWLEGRITEGGRPLVGARVRAEASGRIYLPGLREPDQARTDRRGELRLGPLNGGPYALVVSHPARFVDARFELELVEGVNRFDRDLPDTVILGHTLGPDGALAGAEVTVRELDAPASSSSFSISFGAGDGTTIDVSGEGDRRVRTATDGSFELRGLPAGSRLEVVAQHPGLLPARSEPIRLHAGEHRTGVDLRLAPGAALLVRVLGAGTGTPAGTVSLSLVPVLAELGPDGDPLPDPALEAAKGETDARGEARLEGLAPGRYRLIAIGSDGSVRPALTVELRAGETAHADL